MGAMRRNDCLIKRSYNPLTVGYSGKEEVSPPKMLIRLQSGVVKSKGMQIDTLNIKNIDKS